MNGQTVATLNQLYSSEWFNRVGVSDTDSARVLTSWNEAIASCEAPEWEELTQEAANRYREQVARRSPEQLRRWNEIVRELKPTVEELVSTKTAAVVAEHGLPNVFVDVVRWDMLHLCMESEYADVFPPGFYAAQAYWYSVGHFPCGWDGDFPDGNLVIY